MRRNHGITLIILVVTSVILLILIGVIFTGTGKDIIDKAIQARTRMKIAMRDEKDEMKWAENYDLKNYNEVLLKDNVEIGDYIEYSVEYKDVYTGKYYNKWNGWRVIDINEDGIKIISVGIPILWYYQYEDSETVGNFEELNELRIDDKTIIAGRNLKINGIAKKVENLSLEDLNNYCNKIYGANRKENDRSKLDKSYELFYLKDRYSYYWLSTKDMEDDKRLYYVGKEGIKSEEDYRVGIRPVITLNENLVGAYFNCVWKYVH